MIKHFRQYTEFWILIGAILAIIGNQHLINNRMSRQQEQIEFIMNQSEVNRLKLIDHDKQFYSLHWEGKK